MAVTIISKPKEPITIYRFGPSTDGDADMKDVLGGKGANLAEMAAMGIQVPPGFTIPCEASVRYLSRKMGNSQSPIADFKGMIWGQVAHGLSYLLDHFGYNPLLSVRSGARVSMPGMMDTILNVGITQETLPEWKERLGARAALDSYRRLIQMYASVAMGIPSLVFEEELEHMKEQCKVATDSELNEDQLSRLISRYHKRIVAHGKVFPDTLKEQLEGAIYAVFESWNSERAIEYRKIYGYPDEWGTAVNIQAMVFGNMDDKSCTGVAFTRDPSTGQNILTGDWLPNAQGEDVVAGIRPTLNMYDFDKWSTHLSNELSALSTKLENRFKDMQDIEFTVQSGKLYLLQTRDGKRSARAAFKIAHDMVGENLITKEEALKRVTPKLLFASLQDTIDPKFTKKPILTGIPGGGGVISAVAVFSKEDAANCTKPYILVTKETTPEDVGVMSKSVGILTATGGITSHAAVVARGMNKVCVVGASLLTFSGGSACLKGFHSFSKGDTITIDGATGKVWLGEIPIIKGEATKEVRTLVTWAVEKGKYAERISIGPTDTHDDFHKAVSGSTLDSLYIDTAGIRDMSYSQAFAWVKKIGEILEKDAQGKKIIVDISRLEDHFVASDLCLVKLFGEMNIGGFIPVIDSMKEWGDCLKSSVMVKVPPNVGKFEEVLRLSGFKIFKTVEVLTFQDLLKAKGPVEVRPSVVESVFGNLESLLKAMKLVEADVGVSLESSQPVYWQEFLGGK